MFIRLTIMALIMTSGLILITGCGSDSDTPTTPTTVTMVDTAPPSVPTNLNVSSLEHWVKVAWDSNTADSDFMGFNVYRQAFGGSFLVTETPLQNSTFIDYFPLSNGCIYAVTAIDETGNESAWALIDYVVPPVEEFDLENQNPAGF